MHEIDAQLVVRLTQELIRRKTGPGDEQAVAEFLLEVMPGLGFQEVALDVLGNVTGVIQGAEQGPTLLFDAHTDTIGVAPGVPWTYEPYQGTVAGSRLYGRGASDMKGALAAMLAAAAAADRSRLAGRVVVSASVMEEVLEGAALKAVMARFKPDYVVIGEASDLKIVRGGRGRAEILIETIGRPAHTSAPHQGINAVEAMLPVIQGIQAMKPGSHPVLGEGVMVLTDIISEPYPGHSVIPSRCRATYDRRLLVGETQAGLFESLDNLETIPGATLDTRLATGEYRTFTGEVVAMEKWFPAWLLETSHPFVHAAAGALEKAGLEVSFTTYQFCTNAAYSIGTAGVPTIGFGPSQEILVHIVDEFVEIEQLAGAARGYRALMETLLA
jgi:putative selenium metabolism hydrolase